MNVDISDAIPSRHFAIPPYRAECANAADDWWMVLNANGLNVLSFASAPGAKFTTEWHAKAIADGWNNAIRLP